MLKRKQVTQKIRPEKRRIQRQPDRSEIRRRKKVLHTQFKTAMRHEIANLLTHGIGLGLALAGAVFLIVQGALAHNTLRIVSYSIFGMAMVLLYLASSLYHALWHPQIKKIMRRLDHGSIFLAIAGTYTPILLISLHGALGWTFFGIIWGLAALGVTFKMIFGHRFEAVSLTAYILMGWLIVFIAKPVYLSLAGGGLWLLFAGGILYTAGTIFYAMHRLPYHHMIWHLFVLSGSVCHFLCIYLYV